MRPNVTGRSLADVTLDTLGPTLAELTFVVLDLETSGGAPDADAITEIGAVKVRGGEVLGEYQTLVNPGRPIAEFVCELTGITDAMVSRAPTISAVLPSLLEFLSGSVLVAHNAGFDVSFLRAACERHGREWPDLPVLDTVQLARRVLATDDDVHDCRLATLAELFHARVAPSHRALDDARATVDVLHGLFERVGCEGVTTFEELRSYSARISAVQRRKRGLADTVPPVSGVYLQLDAHDRVVHVACADDVHAEIRRLVTASALPRRQLDLLAVTERIDVIACATPLEAQIRQIRLRAAAGLKRKTGSFGRPAAAADVEGRSTLRRTAELVAVHRSSSRPTGSPALVAVIRRGRLHNAGWADDDQIHAMAQTLADQPPLEPVARVTNAETDALLDWLWQADVVGPPPTAEPSASGG